MSVRRCQQEVDSAEFAEWIAYYDLEPFGYDRHDVGHAIVASTIANVFSKRRHKVVDFMPAYKQRSKPKQTISHMRQLMNVYTELHNAKFK